MHNSVPDLAVRAAILITYDIHILIPERSNLLFLGYQKG